MEKRATATEENVCAEESSPRATSTDTKRSASWHKEKSQVVSALRESIKEREEYANVARRWPKQTMLVTNAKRVPNGEAGPYRGCSAFQGQGQDVDDDVDDVDDVDDDDDDDDDDIDDDDIDDDDKITECALFSLFSLNVSCFH